MTNKLPEYSNTEKLGKLGVRLVENIVENELGWLFREQKDHDYGIDAQIEVVNEDQVTGKLVAVQIKCGESYFKESDTNGYIFRPEVKHANYWTGYSIPVIIVICHSTLKECWWIEFIKENIVNTGKSCKIIIPFGQKFDSSYKHVLAQIAGRTLPERIRQRDRRRLALAPIIEDREFIEIIHRGGVLMGFKHINGIDYRALAFSQDYMLYQSDSFYDIETWKNIFESLGLEDWEIEESIKKID